MHILTIYGDELYHHGIPGQKWGLRRFQNKDGTWTAEGKARRASVFAVDSAKTLNKAYKYSDKYYIRGSEKYYIRARKAASNIRYKENVIKKGTKLDRVSLNEVEDKAAKIYTSLHGDKSASDYYNNEWAEVLKTIGEKNKSSGNVKVYRNTYEVKTDIIAPSKKDRVKAIKTIMEQDKSLKEEFGKEYVNNRLLVYTLMDTDYSSKTYGMTQKQQINKLTESRGKEYVSRIIKRAESDADMILTGNSSNKTLADNNLDRSMMSVIPRSPKLMDAYTSELKKQGFGAVYDMNAGGSSDAPFIIFDQDYVEQVGSKQIR